MSCTSYKPLADRVIIEQEAAEEKTASGIVLPDTAQEKPQTGRVIAVGEGRVTDAGQKLELGVKVGDVVIYAKYGGTEIKDNNKELIILKESDILAIKNN